MIQAMYQERRLMVNQNKRTVISLPSDREILITRLFDASRELVFRAHTDPALIPLWWGPASTTTIVDQMDVRPGGKYRFIHRPGDGSEYVFYGEFREIVPPERLVQTSGMEGTPDNVLETLTFEDLDGKTRLTVLDVCPTQEVRDAIIASGMEEGLDESYNRMEELLAKPGELA
jgi:uncharacterized protein YndB with AHSA1/START domain